MRAFISAGMLALIAAISVSGASAQTTYQLGPVGSTSTLRSGYDYWAIEAWVPAGESHGDPYVAASPSGTLAQAGLVVNTAGVWGNYIPAQTIWNYQTGGLDAYPLIFAVDLARKADGSPEIIGGSSSPRAIPGGLEAAVWNLSANRQSLVPTVMGFITGTQQTAITGGSSVAGYAASDSVGPAVVSTSSIDFLPTGQPPKWGIPKDRYGDLIVGFVDQKAAVWRRINGTWVLNTPEIPSWSDGTGDVKEIAGSKMGGWLYNVALDDVVPVIWNTNNGTISKVFDTLSGYIVTEMTLDHNVVVTLLNKGENAETTGPSYLFADGWDNARLIYGDLLPASAAGTASTVLDISSGGSLWMLTKNVTSNGTSHVVASVTSNAAPTPPTAGTWHNNTLGSDVNSDGKVTALDALAVADYLRANGAKTLAPAPVGNTLFLDVNGDGKASSADVKMIIDYRYAAMKKKLVAAKRLTDTFSPLDLPNTSSAIIKAKTKASTNLLTAFVSVPFNKIEQRVLTDKDMLKAAGNILANLVNTYVAVEKIILNPPPPPPKRRR